MNLSVEETWKVLTKDLNEKKSDWWLKITEKLTDEKRKCHNLAYLETKFDIYRTISHLIKNKTALEFALFFSYLEYGPIVTNAHERNIDHFKKFASDCGLSQDTETYKGVVSLLDATGSSITEEHKEETAFGNEDKHYFLDLDVAVLGADQQVYAEYWKNEKEEYDFLPAEMYNSLRIKVLKTFLTIPNIFATKEFRERYEESARLNIQQDVSLFEQ